MSNLKTQLTVTAHDQVRLAVRVEKAAVLLAEKTQKALLGELPPILNEGESPPDLSGCGLVAARWLGWRRQRLEAAEGRYARELRTDQRLRQARDEALAQLIDSLRVVQARLDLAVGKGRSGSFAGFSTGLQDLEPALLVRIATQAVEELRRNDFGLSGAKAAAAAADLADLAQMVEQPLGDLTRILDELPASLLLTEDALQAKQAELDLLTRDARRVSGFLIASYRLVGLEFHAERLRPKARASGEASEEEETLPAVPEPAAPAAGTPEVGNPANDTTLPAEAAG